MSHTVNEFNFNQNARFNILISVANVNIGFNHLYDLRLVLKLVCYHIARDCITH